LPKISPKTIQPIDVAGEAGGNLHHSGYFIVCFWHLLFTELGCHGEKAVRFPSPESVFLTLDRFATKARVLNLQRTILGLIAACGLLSTGYFGYSATTGNQTFQVMVPSQISIVAPAASPVPTYSGTGDANIGFARQDWSVKCNSVNGATVILQTATCFQHTSTSMMKRDGRLALRVNSTSGPANWAVTRATDRTWYSTGDEDAVVQAVSNKAGEAQLGLSVTFLTGIGADLEEGDYALTIVGTITAN